MLAPCVTQMSSDHCAVHYCSKVLLETHVQTRAYIDGVSGSRISTASPPAGLLRATISQYSELGSLEFSKKLLLEAEVAVSPGIGFGDQGDGHVRFSLIENEERTRQALRGIKQMFRAG